MNNLTGTKIYHGLEVIQVSCSGKTSEKKSILGEVRKEIAL